MRASVIAVSVVSVFFALALSSVSLADTQLGSGSTDFTVNPIFLSDIPLEKGQYCGNPSDPSTQNFRLSLVGDTSFLNVRWKAADPGGIEREIGVDCFMNCNATSDLLNNCAGYQSCSYKGPTGDHACSIQGPSYKYNADNRVVCRFYDPILPSLDLVIESRTFKTTDYSIDTPPITLTVGSPATVPIDVKSFGILENSYTNNMTALQSQQLVIVQNGFANTDTVSCGEVTRTFPSVNFLSSINIPFSILVHNSIDSTPCSTNSQCSYLDNAGYTAQCISSKCWKRLDLSINAGVASLPEYNIYGFILIIIASSVVFFAARKKL